MRILFESGSEKSFVSPIVVKEICAVRKKNLGIRAFGSEDTDRKVQDVVELDLRAKKCEGRVKIETYVVNKMSDVANFHAELVRTQHNHSRDIEFSDAADENALQADVIVDESFLWEFAGRRLEEGREMI